MTQGLKELLYHITLHTMSWSRKNNSSWRVQWQVRDAADIQLVAGCKHTKNYMKAQVRKRGSAL